MAHHYGYAAVRPADQPLDAWEYELWWAFMQRYNLLQTKEGRDQIKLSVQVHRAEQAEAGEAFDPAKPAKTVADGTRLSPKVWTNPARLLALLPEDDPRAIFVRAGGRLDASGNPLKDDGTPYVGIGKLPAWYTRAQEEMKPRAFDPMRPPPPYASPPPPAPPTTATPTPTESTAESDPPLQQPNWLRGGSGQSDWPDLPDLPDLLR